MHFFSLSYFNNHPLHVSKRLTIHHQEVAASTIMLVASQRRCIINAICRVYSKLPPFDE